MQVLFLNEDHKDGKMCDLYREPCTIVQKLSDINFNIQNPANAFIMWSIMINQNLIRIYIYESSFYRGDENMFLP